MDNLAVTSCNPLLANTSAQYGLSSTCSCSLSQSRGRGTKETTAMAENRRGFHQAGNREQDERPLFLPLILGSLNGRGDRLRIIHGSSSRASILLLRRHARPLYAQSAWIIRRRVLSALPLLANFLCFVCAPIPSRSRILLGSFIKSHTRRGAGSIFFCIFCECFAFTTIAPLFPSEFSAPAPETPG